MGTKNDIVWFQKILQRHPKVEVLEISELYEKHWLRDVKRIMQRKVNRQPKSKHNITI